MNFRPSTAPGRDRERMITTMSITNRAGIPTLLNFSMPPETPPLTISMQMTINTSVNTKQPKGLVSMAPKVVPPLMELPKMLLRPKLSSARFRDMYCRQ